MRRKLYSRCLGYLTVRTQGVTGQFLYHFLVMLSVMFSSRRARLYDILDSGANFSDVPPISMPLSEGRPRMVTGHAKLSHFHVILSAHAPDVVHTIPPKPSPPTSPPQTMLSRQVLARAARPLARFASSSSSVPSAPAASSPSTVVPQAPNYASTWSTNQAPRPQGRSGPRFEQTAMELQPNPLSAMEMIANEPIRVVNGRKAVCDGGM